MPKANIDCGVTHSTVSSALTDVNMKLAEEMYAKADSQGQAWLDSWSPRIGLSSRLIYHLVSATSQTPGEGAGSDSSLEGV